jgi:hypothetical protein
MTSAYTAHRIVSYLKPSNSFSIAYVDDQISLQRARIAWNEDENDQITEVFIDELTQDWLDSSQYYLKSGGACFSDWEKQADEEDTGTNFVEVDSLLDAFGTFGIFLARGFVNSESYRQALIEFSRISECHWARRLLLAYDLAHNRDLVLSSSDS